MLKQWLYVLRADGLEITSSRSFYSYTEAQETAKNIAIGMHYKDKRKWSFEVVECDFEPEEINKKEMPVLGYNPLPMISPVTFTQISQKV